MQEISNPMSVRRYKPDIGKVPHTALATSW